MSPKNKVKTISQVVQLVKKPRNNGKTLGFITGCFDIIHIGHIELFQFAKRNVDIVVVGLDNDKNVRLSKGKDRQYILLSKEVK